MLPAKNARERLLRPDILSLSMKAKLSVLALLSACCSQALGALVVNQDLGTLGVGTVRLVGDTAAGADNAHSYTSAGSQAGLWGTTEWVYQFAIDEELTATLTSAAVVGDPDTFLLNSLETVAGDATGAMVAAYLDGATPDTADLGLLSPGTYYLSVDSYGTGTSATFDFALDLSVFTLNTPTAIDLGTLGDDNTFITLNTFGSEIGDTELGLYDARGRFLVNNDDAEGGLQSQLHITSIPEGTYYAAVGAYNTNFASTNFDVLGGGEGGGITLNHNGGSTTTSIDPWDEASGVAWFSFAIVPEPSSMSLLALAGLTLLRRRRS